MTPNSVALFYGHVSSNIGDIAINRGTVNLIEKVFPGARITAVLLGVEQSPHLPGGLESFGKGKNINFVHLAATPEQGLSYAMDPARLLTDCGCEGVELIVLAAGEHLFGYEANPNTRNLFWRTLPAFAARITGKRCMVMPSTFGPFETADARNLLSLFTDACDRLAIRDLQSGPQVADIVPEAKCPPGLDPAFFLEPPAKAAGGSTGRVGIVMRSEGWGLRVSREVRGQFTKAVAKKGYDASLAYRFTSALARKILADGDRRVRLFVQLEADRAVAEAVAESLKGKPGADRLEIVTPGSIDEYLAMLAEVDCVVASRFHALILGMTCGKPGFGVYFDAHGHKIPGLFELLGIPDDCLNLSLVPPDEAARTVFAKFIAEERQFKATGARMEALRKKTAAWMSAPLKARKALAAPPLEVVRALTGQIVAYGESLHEAEMTRLRNQVNQLNRKLEGKIERERSQLMRIAALETQLDRLESSIAYRLGSAVVDTMKSPRSLVRMPRRVMALYAEHRRRGDHGSNGERRMQVDQMDLSRILDIYRDKGSDGVIGYIRGRHPENRAACRNELIAVARLLAREGFPDAEFALVREAVEVEQSDASLRAMHWVAQRRGDYLAAWDCIRQIEILYRDNPGPAQEAMLAKLRRSPANQLSLLDMVPPKPVLAANPVANRVAYILHNSLPYSSGGYATRAQGLAQGLIEAGLEPVILTRPGFPLDIKPELAPRQVPLKETIQGLEHRRLLSPLRTGNSALEYMKHSADALTKELADMRPAAIVAASNHVTSLPAMIAARRLGVPFFYEVRGFWEITRISREPEFEETASYKVQKLIESEVAKRADHVFTLTGPMRDELIARGVPGKTITLLPNSCEPARFTPRERDARLAARLGIPADVPVIGYIGTFVQYEGLEFLVEAAAALRDRGQTFRLLLVGNENASGSDVGPITAQINAIARERGLAEWLIMPGRVPYEEVEAYYSLIDIAPFPRKPQPVTELVSPIKPLEAMAMEKAVVVSSVAALMEMVDDGRTGLVFEKGNVASLADTLARLIADPELRARLGRAGRKWVTAERTWTATARLAAERINETIAHYRANAA